MFVIRWAPFVVTNVVAFMVVVCPLRGQSSRSREEECC